MSARRDFAQLAVRGYCELKGDTIMKKNLTTTKIALIAAAASVLTSAMHGTMQAINIQNVNTLHVLFYVAGRVIGDLPAAVICFGLAYGLLKVIGNHHGDGGAV